MSQAEVVAFGNTANAWYGKGLNMPDSDVMITGYGPTGTVAANLYGATGLKVLLVEPNW